MKRLITSIVVILSFVQALSAQTVISGDVRDNEQVAIQNAIISVIDNGKIIGYALTKQDGSYRLSYTSESSELIITADLMSYKKEEKRIRNKAQTIDFILKAEATQLKEAVVSAPVVTMIGDTLRFNIPALVSQGDATLEDALKKVPGISVADNGEIRYLGKAISNFYIEGLEMLNGNYSMATRNLPVEHISDVEVLNNHQAIKMDKDKISDKVALNVKLKKDAFFKPVGTSELAGGYSSDRLLYTVGATGMFFGDKGQVLITAKIGNIDEFAMSQSSSLTANSGSSSQLAVNEIGRISTNSPSLPVSRYLNIDGRLVSANSVIKISEDRTLRINTGYAWQKQSNLSSTQSEYYLGDKEYLTIDQSYSTQSRVHSPTLSMEYTRNSEKRYILNKFDFSGSFADYSLPVVENGITIGQDQKLNSYQLGNNLIWGFKTGALDWSAQTDVKYFNTPTLKVDISSTTASYNATQEASSRTFDFYQYLNTSYKSGKSVYIFPITFKLTDDTVESELHRGDLISQNLVKGTNGELKIRPNYSYESLDKKFKLSAHLSLRGVILKGSNKYVDGQNLNYKAFYLDPSLTINYLLSPENDLQFRSSYNNNQGNINTLLTNPVMRDYRSISSKQGTLTKNRIASVSLDWRYNNPISLWFASYRVMYNNSLSNMMPSLFVTGDSSTSSMVENDTHSHSVSSNAEISKRVSSIKGKFTLRGGWNWNQSEMIQQNIMVPYIGNRYNAGADINMQPVNWMEVKLTANWSLTSSKYESVENTYQNLTGKASLSFFPVKNLTILLNGDYSHLQVSDGNYKDMTMFDAQVSYKIKAVTLKLSANNLLDQKHYSYTVFSGLDTHSYDFTLRPRELILSVQFTM